MPLSVPRGGNELPTFGPDSILDWVVILAVFPTFYLLRRIGLSDLSAAGGVFCYLGLLIVVARRARAYHSPSYEGVAAVRIGVAYIVLGLVSFWRGRRKAK